MLPEYSRASVSRFVRRRGTARARDTDDNLQYVAVVVAVSLALVLGIIYPIDNLRKRLATGDTTPRKLAVPAPAE
jgi:hypothetical protein